MKVFGMLLLLSWLACTPVRESRVSMEGVPGEAAGSWSGADWGREMLRHVNALRAQGCRCGGKRMSAVPALEWSEALYRAALLHSKDMARNDHFDHRGTNGSTVSERVKRFDKSANYVGENIAWASWARTPREVVQALKESTGHCKNMMNANYSYFGAADVSNYSTQVLAGGVEH